MSSLLTARHDWSAHLVAAGIVAGVPFNLMQLDNLTDELNNWQLTSPRGFLSEKYYLRLPSLIRGHVSSLESPSALLTDAALCLETSAHNTTMQRGSCWQQSIC